MDEYRTTRKIPNWTPTLLNRPKGRPKERWLDMKIVGILDWKKKRFRREKMARVT
jgi:hypothetical protein